MVNKAARAVGSNVMEHTEVVLKILMLSSIPLEPWSHLGKAENKNGR
jgi:hypothetical protein